VTALAGDLDRVLRFVRDIGSAGHYRKERDERRRENRYALAMVVDLVPLDAGMTPCGPPQRGVTRDLSPSGIGLFAEIPLQAKFLRVLLPIHPIERVEVLVEILRCEPFGFLYNIGGRFVETG
jgi:hypothetical protein